METTWSDSTSSLNATITELGIDPMFTSDVSIVMHSATIPFPDFIWRRLENPSFRDHGDYQIAGCDMERCICQRGMYQTKEKCPCVETKSDEICFLTGLPKIMADNRAGKKPSLNGQYITVCHDHISIFAEKYPANIRNRNGYASWSNVTELTLIVDLLQSTYWFSKEEIGITKLCLEGKAPKEMRAILFNTIGQMRNLMIKRWLAFPEIEMSYKEVYEIYRLLYRELLPCFAEGEDGDPEKCNIYLDLKESFNYFKRRFHSEEYEIRAQVFDHEFKSEGAFLLFTVPLRELSQEVLTRFFERGIDETQTPSWMLRFAILCQTRMLGKYPKPLSKKVVEQYLSKITKAHPVDIKQLKNDRLIIRKWISESKLPFNFLKEEWYERPDVHQLRDKCWNSLSLRIKYTASTDQPRSEGGKAREAQILFSKVMNRRIKVPRRDLETGEIKEILSLRENPEEGFFSEYLFWLSMQLVINGLYNGGATQLKPYYYDCQINDNPFRTRIEAINEPGKVRMLVKTTGILYWFLTPMGEIMNEALAFLQEHNAGLKGSAQGWKFQKQLSGRGDQSEMIYTPDWKAKPNLYFGFMDWTEATDFIPRDRGLILLDTLGSYIGVGTFWMRLTMLALRVDYPVDRVTVSKFEEDGSENHTQELVWKGNIMGGFMMGMPVTKTVLHLCHALADKKTDLFYQVKGSYKEPYGSVIKPTYMHVDSFKSTRAFI